MSTSYFQNVISKKHLTSSTFGIMIYTIQTTQETMISYERDKKRIVILKRADGWCESVESNRCYIPRELLL